MADFREIKKYLDQNNIKYEVIELGDRAFTVEDVINSGKATRREIVKTLLVKTEKGSISVCARGEDKIDFNKIQKRFGKSRLARPGEVQEVVGVEVGAVCPIKIGVPILLDEKVLKNVKVNLGSEDHLKGINLKKEDFLKAIENYEVTEITL